MPKVARFNRPSQHRVTSVGQFLQQTSAFPAQVRKVSFEDTSCSSDGCNIMQSSPLEGATSAASSSSSCPVYPSIHETSSTVSQDESPSRDTHETVDTSSSCTSMSPLHRSRAYESLNEQQFLLQQQKQKEEQETSKRLLRRPTTSLCLSDLATAQQSCCIDDEDDDDLTFSPRVSSSSSRPSPASSPWGHFVDVIPMDNGDCSNSYALPTLLDSDNLEDGYFHPDALLFWSQCSDNKSGHRKGHRFEPYKKSSRLSRKAAATTPTFSSEAFSGDFMLPSPCQAVQQQQPYVARSMRLTREVEETMERLHF